MSRVQLDNMVFATAILQPVVDGLQNNVTVTEFAWAKGDIEFEIVVTKIGGKKVPRLRGPQSLATVHRAGARR